jgi:hypothetical protein
MSETANSPNSENAIINAHTHIFISDDTPSQLARKFVPGPIAWMLNTHLIIKISKWIRKINKKKYSFTSQNKAWQKYLASNSPIYGSARRLLLFVINIIFFFYLLYLILPLLSFWPIEGWLNSLYESEWAQKLLIFSKRFQYVWIILFILLVFKKIRNWFFKSSWELLKKRLGKQSIELLLRYINIINFAQYEEMHTVFSKLKLQYPPDSKFIVLPMDMALMKAGKTKRSYRDQMTDLLTIKSNNEKSIFPFLFAHPERMKETINGKPYFKGNITDGGEFELDDCDVKDYFKKGCAGVKIYPATGYYVFDESLLPLWLYCDQKNIPITTHCSVGPIFYRGNLNKLRDKIDEHPIFKQIIGKNPDGSPKEVPLRLPLQKNSVFQRNFTHPLNYCCLLDEEFLKKVLDKHNSAYLNKIFGYKPELQGKPIERNLSNLKINLAHYGGAENWDQFLEQDRYDYANHIINKDEALMLKEKMHNPNILYKYWHSVDWFSIISSMMINFNNVYTDISYTSHDLKYLNLLSQILDNDDIAKRVLFGTDFYVVSNHKSEKQYWIDMQNSLGNHKWKKLSKSNPEEFLKMKPLNLDN